MMSPMLQSRALQIFFRTSIETFSFLPSFAKAMVLIPAFKRKSVFDISRSIKSFQSFLYDVSIFSPLCLSVNTSFACNISTVELNVKCKISFFEYFIAKKWQTLLRTKRWFCHEAWYRNRERFLRENRDFLRDIFELIALNFKKLCFFMEVVSCEKWKV